MTFAAHIVTVAEAVDARLDRWLAPPPDAGAADTRLTGAMRHAALGGGKRLRPFLAIETASLFGLRPDDALDAACALELVHCYSLVHDDLPAMDDDHLRRGRPTLHVAFDEATAILAGDAMQTLAFEILSSPATHADAGVRSELVFALARASGRTGMAGGQARDLAAEGRTLDLEGVRAIHARKTGALIECACLAGAILGRADGLARGALSAYAKNLGLAFQIADDVLDAEGDPARTGKSVGKDAASAKATFVSLMGIEKARAELDRLERDAVASLDMFGDGADRLREAAAFVVARDH